MTFNLSACPLTKTLEKKLDCHHRRQLRRVLDIHYPEFISNEELYKRTDTERISIKILKGRINTLRNIIEIGKKSAEPQDPANKYMRTAMYLDTEYVAKCKTKTSLLDCLRKNFRSVPVLGVKFDHVRDLETLRGWSNKQWNKAERLILQTRREQNEAEDEKTKNKRTLKKRKASEETDMQEQNVANKKAKLNSTQEEQPNDQAMEIDEETIEAPAMMDIEDNTEDNNEDNSKEEDNLVTKKRRKILHQVEIETNRVIDCSTTNVKRVPKRPLP
jgi:hypothetical protein